MLSGEELLYSVRMRASKNKLHISGAERIVEKEDINTTASSLIERAFLHENGVPDFINISVETIEKEIIRIPSLPVACIAVQNAKAGRILACNLLRNIGIEENVVKNAISLLSKGPSPDNKKMRGAVIMNLKGERLEPDQFKGVRVSRMDMTKDAAEVLRKNVDSLNLTMCYRHISEALVLATKVAFMKETLAELCWSDDPGYTAGYVSSRKTGYVRISSLKEKGNPLGGRVFFINDERNLNEYITQLEEKPVLVDRINEIKECSTRDLLKHSKKYLKTQKHLN